MTVAARLRPTCERELCGIVGEAAAAGTPLALTGGGSKTGFGAPDGARMLDMTGFAGVVDYDPGELVLTARPGTPLAEIEALVAEREQMLAFEPFDHGPLYGRPAGRATIGGVVAAGVAGSQRLSAGAARDHLLGFRAVSGRGEAFAAGARVVKNVTGFDLPKLAAGSWGRLFALTELNVKVLPRARARATWAIAGLDAAVAVAAMARALGSPAEVAAAAHVPARGGAPARTALRLQGFGPSVAARGTLLRALLADHGTPERLDEGEATAFWTEVREVRPLPADPPLWRISVPPSAAPRLVAALERGGADWLLDWAGGLVWIAGDIDPTVLRAEAAAAGGHATLVRAAEALRRTVPALHPAAPGVAALEERVRRAFDPRGVFETGRF